MYIRMYIICILFVNEHVYICTVVPPVVQNVMSTSIRNQDKITDYTISWKVSVKCMALWGVYPHVSEHLYH